MAGGGDHGPGLAGSLLIGAVAFGVIAISVAAVVGVVGDKAERWGWVDVVRETPTQQRPSFQGVTPSPGQNTTHPSWPQTTKTTRQEGRDTVTTTVEAVPKMTAEICRTKYGGKWEPSTTGGPNICRR